MQTGLLLLLADGEYMAKKSNKTVFVCQECGYESAKWMGQCICGAWNTMVEEKVVDINQEDKRRRASVSVGSKVRREGAYRYRHR